jgi:hypothetical protein
MNLFKDLVKKYGIGIILGSATLNSYRRQVTNDRRNNILEEVKKDRNALTEDRNALIDQAVEDSMSKAKNQATFSRYNESADEPKKSVDKYEKDPSEYNLNEMKKANKKLDEAFDDIKKLDISEIFTSLYNKYEEYLNSLTPDKIACLFNIIIDGLLLSSFFSVLSIMLSDNIISKIGFLEKYPKILNLLKLRNNINKKISKSYLFIHFIIIIFGILGNIWMFFI